MTARPDLERIDAVRSLLAVYARAGEQPTENELWCGCKDGALALEECLAYIRAQDERIGEMEAALQQIHEDTECIHIREAARAALPAAAAEPPNHPKP